MSCLRNATRLFRVITGRIGKRQGIRVMILIGHNITELRKLPEKSVHCVVTSCDSDAVQFLGAKPQGFAAINVFIREGFVCNLHSFPGPVSKVAVSGDFGSMLLRRGLEIAKFENCVCLVFLDPQEREKGSQDVLCLFVARLKAEERTPVVAMGFFWVVPAPKRGCQKRNCRLINHSHLNAGVVSGRLSSLACVCLRFLDSDVSLSINDSGEIRDVCVFHDESPASVVCVTTIIGVSGAWSNSCRPQHSADEEPCGGERAHCCHLPAVLNWGLRAYGTDPQTWGDGWVGELGSEPTPEMFVAHIVEVFAEVWRVLRDDGTCWVNLGDSYSAGGRGSFDVTSDNKGNGAIRGLSRPSLAGVKPKDLIGIPWRVAFALQSAGWYLRQDIIWHKPNPMPESVRDRRTKAHEYLFLLTKSERYFFDGEAIKTPVSAKTLTVSTTPRKGTGVESTGEKLNAWMEANGGRQHPSAANRRSVWSISTHSYKGAHFATYPPRLVEPCILAGTSAKGCCPHCGKPWVRVIESNRVATRPGVETKVTGNAKAEGNRDPQRHVSVKVTTGWQQACKCEAHEPVPCVVLDPFGGSGTTAIVAAHYGRKWIICELNPEYAGLAEQRISEGWTPPKLKKTGRVRNGRRELVLFE